MRKRKRKHKLSGIDKVLIFSVVMLIIFTIVNIILFINYQAIPDSLVVAFFGAFSIETLNTYRIWKDKEKRGKYKATEVYEDDV